MRASNRTISKISQRARSKVISRRNLISLTTKTNQVMLPVKQTIWYLTSKKETMILQSLRWEIFLTSINKTMNRLMITAKLAWNLMRTRTKRAMSFTCKILSSVIQTVVHKLMIMLYRSLMVMKWLKMLIKMIVVNNFKNLVKNLMIINKCICSLIMVWCRELSHQSEKTSELTLATLKTKSKLIRIKIPRDSHCSSLKKLHLKAQCITHRALK